MDVDVDEVVREPSISDLSPIIRVFMGDGVRFM